MFNKPVIYLTGPMSNCNEIQKTLWRRKLKEKYSNDYTFIDPTEDLVDTKLPDREVVKRDLNAIKKADGVLANMWKESIGTVIGIMEANKEGKPTVLVDQNNIRSRMLAFYFEFIEDSPENALNLLGQILIPSRQINFVIKEKNKPEEKFEPKKLIRSIRRACEKAGKDEIVIPAEITPKVMSKLNPIEVDGSRYISSEEIKVCIFNTLIEFHYDDRMQNEIIGIRKAWIEYEKDKSQNSEAYSNLILKIENLENENQNLLENYKNIFESYYNEKKPDPMPKPSKSNNIGEFKNISIGVVGGCNNINIKDIKNLISNQFGGCLIYNNGIDKTKLESISNCDLIIIWTGPGLTHTNSNILSKYINHRNKKYDDDRIKQKNKNSIEYKDYINNYKLLKMKVKRIKGGFSKLKSFLNDLDIGELNKIIKKRNYRIQNGRYLG